MTGLPCDRWTGRRWPPSCSLSSSSALWPLGISQGSSCTAPRTLGAGGSFPVCGPGNPGPHDSGVTAQPRSPAIARPPSFPGRGPRSAAAVPSLQRGSGRRKSSLQPTGRSAGLGVLGLLRAVPGVLEGDRHVSSGQEAAPLSTSPGGAGGVCGLESGRCCWPPGTSLSFPEPQRAHPGMG